MGDPSSSSATGARPGVVYLVGAGPGDPGLVTLRAAELVRTADVVLHDELVPPQLLREARPDARIEYVGKRGTEPAEKQLRQGEIDDLLVAHARAGARVVRLKGGDPFLFGRGSEEAERLVREGVPFEVVPGVSSPFAAAAYAGISLTHRDLASSVTFVSGTTRRGEGFDFRELAGVRGTVCVLMGLGRLEGICAALIAEAGRAPSTPAAVIQAGTRPDQRVVEGTLADLAGRVREAGLGTPAVIVVGEVVALRETLRWFDLRPLFGVRVLSTRPAHQGDELAALLAARGASVLHEPLVAITDPPDAAPLREAVRDLSRWDAVAFTSENAVRRTFAALDAAGRDARAFGGLRVAAVGDATKRALASRGVVADVVPRHFVGDALAEALLDDLASRGGVAGKRVLLPRALVAREVLPERLRDAGAVVDVVPAYQTVTAPEAARAAALVRAREVDVVLLTSSSAASALAEALGDAPVPAGVTVASLGAITTRTAVGRGLPVHVTADESTSEGLVDALVRHLGRQP